MLEQETVLPTLASEDDEEQGQDCPPQARDPPVQVDSSDDEGHAPRRLQPTASDESNDIFLASLCRAPRKLQPTVSDESDDAFLMSLCRKGPSSPGPSPVRVEEERSCTPLASLDLLVSELIAAGMSPPSTSWSLPAQGTVLVNGNMPSPWPAVQKCLWRIASWGKSLGIFVFKIGIAHSPQARWDQYDAEEMWQFMDVMHEDNPEACRCLEKALIGILRKVSGCYNVAPGGEGVRAGAVDGKCFCYTVYAPAGHGVGLREAWRSRMHVRSGGAGCHSRHSPWLSHRGPPPVGFATGGLPAGCCSWRPLQPGAEALARPLLQPASQAAGERPGGGAVRGAARSGRGRPARELAESGEQTRRRQHACTRRSLR